MAFVFRLVPFFATNLGNTQRSMGSGMGFGDSRAKQDSDIWRTHCNQKKLSETGSSTKNTLRRNKDIPPLSRCPCTSSKWLFDSHRFSFWLHCRSPECFLFLPTFFFSYAFLVVCLSYWTQLTFLLFSFFLSGFFFFPESASAVYPYSLGTLLTHTQTHTLSLSFSLFTWMCCLDVGRVNSKQCKLGETFRLASKPSVCCSCSFFWVVVICPWRKQ